MVSRRRRIDRYFRYELPRTQRDGRKKEVCGKICYPTRGLARAGCKGLAHSGKDREPEKRLDVYWCEKCEAWHVGHSGSARPAPSPSHTGRLERDGYS